jgi:hypothetical protein
LEISSLLFFVVAFTFHASRLLTRECSNKSGKNFKRRLMKEDIRQQLRTAIGESEGELEKLGDARKQKRSELRQFRKALTALGGSRQKNKKGKVASITLGGPTKPNADGATH